MRVSLSIALLLISTLGLTAGCGGSDADATTSTSSHGAGAATSSDGVVPDDPIARVAFDFLNAVRNGDIETASSKLTPLALQRTSELDMSFSPPGSPTAKFEIGAVEIVEQDKAIVESIWTDLNPDGQPQDEQIVWALRRVENGWRISGMAAEVDADQPAVIIDFENPGAVFSGEKSASQAATPGPSTPTVQTAQDPFLEATSR